MDGVAAHLYSGGFRLGVFPGHLFLQSLGDTAWNVRDKWSGSAPHYMPLALGKHFLSFLGVDFSYPPFWALVGGKKEILALFFCFFIVLALSNSYEWCRGHLQKTHFSLRWAMAIGGILALSICFLSRISEFLYFQF
jgi:hypothetical protein